MADSRPLGLFDSGLGGLTAVNALARTLPKESFIYVGDTARTPYGQKSVDTLLTYGRQIIDFLANENVKAIVVACGTISSNVMNNLWDEFKLPIIDVVRPGIEEALKQAEKRIGIIATAATIKSGFIQKSIEKNSALEVTAKACPLFVPLIEQGKYDNPITYSIADMYLQEWKENKIDTLVLGCTHYPLLHEPITNVLGNINLIDIADAAIQSTRDYLKNNDMLNESGNVSHKYYISGDVEKFNEIGAKIIGRSLKAEKIYWE